MFPAVVCEDWLADLEVWLQEKLQPGEWIAHSVCSLTFFVSLLDNVPYLKVGTLKIDHGVHSFNAAE